MNMYYMSTFNPNHVNNLIISLAITFILLLLSIPFNKYKYGKFFGVIILLSKAIDIIIRIFFERIIVDGVVSTPILALPLNLCNIAVILSGIYLITRNKYLYNIIYTWMYGAILVMFIPSNFYYMGRLYPVLFFLTHVLIIGAVIYGKIFYKARVSKKGTIVSMIVILLFMALAYFVNINYGTNFFFLAAPPIPLLNKLIFNFGWSVYYLVYISGHLLTISILYKLDR